MKINNYYVYVYLDPRKPGSFKYKEFVFDYEPFYIGKGKFNRITYHIRQSTLDNDYNKIKNNKIKEIIHDKLKPIIIKYKSNLFENEAYNLESKMVKTIGRVDKKTGPLTNLTGGGAGATEYIYTEQLRQKMSKRNRGKNNPNFGNGDKIRGEKNIWYGKHLSPEICDKISKNHADVKGKKHPMFGKHHTEESRNKMSKAKMGHIPWNKGLTKETDSRIDNSPKTENFKKIMSQKNSGKNNKMYGKGKYDYYINGIKIESLLYFCKENNLNYNGVTSIFRRGLSEYLYKKKWFIQRRLKNE
jgi:hypothetical protein